jgi:hypothetical protein
MESVCLAIVLTIIYAQANSEPQSDTNANVIQRVQEFNAARMRKDYDTARNYLSPDARVWYERREGAGEPWTVKGGTWAHWDGYFNGKTEYSDWKADGLIVTATANETNDYYRLLDWHPWPMKFTWWFNESGKLSGFLVQAVKGKGSTGSRLEEFKKWAASNNPEELRYLMPNGNIDPTGDRAERWRKILIEWRKAVRLPPVELGPPGETDR